jgi:hypothetical protein
MLGPRITTVFRSRWNALFWAAGVLLAAYCSIPRPEDQPDAAAGDDAAVGEAHHVNPWARDPAQQ